LKKYKAGDSNPFINAIFEKHSSAYKKKKQWDDQYFKNKDKIIKDEIMTNTKYLNATN